MTRRGHEATLTRCPSPYGPGEGVASVESAPASGELHRTDRRQFPEGFNAAEGGNATSSQGSHNLSSWSIPEGDE